MLGISDFGAFCAAILLFLALPGPGTFALLTSTASITALAAFAPASLFAATPASKATAPGPAAAPPAANAQ